MGYTKEEIVARISQMVMTKAGQVAEEEIAAYEKAHADINIPGEIKDKVVQRAGSELLFRMNYFKDYAEGIDEQTLTDNFEAWFLVEENEKLRHVCQGNIKELLSKCKKNEDEGLSFMERFTKMVKTQGKAMNTVEMMHDLNTKQ